MNKQKTIQIIVGVLFFGLLAGVYIYEQGGTLYGGQEASVDQEKAMQRYGFYLEEVSGEAGVEFTHQAPELDPKIDHIMPQVASMGASVSVTDFNKDGRQDFYLTNSKRGTQNALYKNNGDGTFSDVATDAGIADLNTEAAGASMGSVWGDYDNDGYEDLFVYRWGRPALFHNDNGEGFTEVTGASEFPDRVNANAAIWFDYDADGFLDLFLAGYFDEKFDLWNLETTKIMTESFEYSNNGGRTYLFHNNGDGTFEEVSKPMGIESNRWALSASSADLTGNGYPDLIIANDYGVDELYINRGGKRFVESGEEAGMGFAPKSGMNVSYGDVLNQGDLAVYITNISEPGVLMQGNNLWVPRSKGENAVSFQNLAGNIGAEIGGWSYGAQFGDLNNDGFLDLYVANGFISGDEGSDYWYDFSMVTGGNRAIISDAENWPSMEGRSLSGYQENKVWINDGAGRFQEVGAGVGGALKLDSRSVAFADLWDRGVLDIIVASQNGPVKILKNTTGQGKEWIGFDLEGKASNKSAIGAEVELFWNGKSQIQVISGGSGFSAQNQRPLHFGLGDAPEVEKAEIRWPSGRVQKISSPAVDSLHKIAETE
jgi:hypothetical protein